MTMHAITLRQPWAHAVAHFGKDVENRTRRPPAHLVGQRVAIHVGKSWDAWDAICADGLEHSDHPALPPALLDWMDTAEEGGKAPPPDAGRVIATARLIGVCGRKDGDPWCATPGPHLAGPDEIATLAALDSPWLTGPVGWVLADVRPLAVPVGERPALGCVACKVAGLHVQDGARCPNCNAKTGYLRRYDHAIRGQLYPFALSADVEAAILRQEGKC